MTAPLPRPSTAASAGQKPVYVYHDGTRGELLSHRPVLRYLLRESGLDVLVGVCAGDEQLIEDLVSKDRIVCTRTGSSPHGALLSPRMLCPAERTPIALGAGDGRDLVGAHWWDRVHWLLKELHDAGIQPLAGPDTDAVPMFDFEQQRCDVPRVQRPSIFLELERDERDSSWFVFDLERIARIHRGFDILCTTQPRSQEPNLIDVSALGLIERSWLSESCEILVGRSHTPFVVTFTEANRYKPRAVCGYDAREQARFWDYPGSPLEYVKGMDELMDFLAANTRTHLHTGIGHP